MLIANGAEIDAANDEGQTPLLLAAWSGHKDVVELLLANKANVNAQDSHGTTPLQIALDSTNAAIVALFRQYGATNN